MVEDGGVSVRRSGLKLYTIVPTGFRISPMRMNDIMLEKDKTKTYSLKLYVPEVSEDFDSTLSVRIANESGEIEVSEKRFIRVVVPRTIEIISGVEIQIPPTRVLQERAFYNVNRVFNRVVRSTIFWLTTLLVLLVLFYGYYRFRRHEY